MFHAKRIIVLDVPYVTKFEINNEMGSHNLYIGTTYPIKSTFYIFTSLEKASDYIYQQNSCYTDFHRTWIQGLESNLIVL